MNPEAIRDMNWEEIQGRLEGWRGRIYEALAKHGPCTTHELAGASGISLLTVRPRITELVQLGWVECLEMVHKEGRYHAIPEARALANWTAERARREGEGRQLEMKF